MAEMKLYSHEKMLDAVVGKKGTPRRDKYESDMDNFLIGEAIKQARTRKGLTQEQLAELVGVQRAQISKIESGKSITYSTIVKVFKAMGQNRPVLT